MKLPIYLVDAFTNKAFGGNPAAVCLTLDKQLTKSQMQSLGAEMNLSETAFVIADKESDFVEGDTFKLRWFTPTVEVPLCGHATLASAAVLFYKKENIKKELKFETLSGILSVVKTDDLLSMDFPINRCEPKDVGDYNELIKVCLGDSGVEVHSVHFSETTKKLIIRLSDGTSRNTLENIKPDIPRMIESDRSGAVKGVCLTLKGSKANNCIDDQGLPYDFVSRYFNPWVGIPEDPVTGSLHTVLADYWCKELNKSQLYARQCSARGGDVSIKVNGQRVSLSGQAVINLDGMFNLTEN